MVMVPLVGFWACSDEPIIDPADPDGPPTNLVIDVTSGEYLDEVTITGKNFHAASNYNTVMIGGAKAPIESSTTTEIVATVPWEAAWGVGDVTVTVGSNTATVTSSFEVTPPTPQIFSYEPAFAPEGDTIIISGMNFSNTAADNVVKFNGVAGTVVDADSLIISAQVPVGATTGPVTVTVNGLTAEGPTFSVVEVTVVEIVVIDTNQDAEEMSNDYWDGWVYTGSTDLEMGMWDTWDTPDKGAVTVGLAYPDVQIPKGVIILQAYIQFEADADDDVPWQVTIWGDNTANADMFADDPDPELSIPPDPSTNSFDISGRPKTPMSAVWNMPTWVTGDRGVDQRTPDLKEIVQHLIDLDGWAAGNTMAFMLAASGDNANPTVDDAGNGREAECGPGDGPSLYIVYAQ